MVRPDLFPSRSRATDNSNWTAYREDCKTKLLLGGKLVDRTSLTTLVGFIGRPIAISDGKEDVRGSIFELAEQTNGNSQVPEAFSLRPNLWKRTGETVVLRNYKPDREIGVLTQVFVMEASPVLDHRSFDVASEPSLEQWMQVRAQRGRL